MSKHPSSSKKPVIGITSEINGATNMCEANFEYARAISLEGGMPAFIAPPFPIPTRTLMMCWGASTGAPFRRRQHFARILRWRQSHRHFPWARSGHGTRSVRNQTDARGVPTRCARIRHLQRAAGHKCGIGRHPLLRYRRRLRFGVAMHSQENPYESPSHKVEIKSCSFLASLLKASGNACGSSSGSVRVNSIHHQAIRDMAEHLAPCAFCDPVIEAAEADSRSFFLGVQWHSEYLPQFAFLFDTFVESTGVNRDAALA